MTTPTFPAAPLPPFASLRRQAAVRFLAIAGTPCLAWVLSCIDWPSQAMGVPLKALAYKVIQLEMWLSAPQVSVPLLAGFALLWLALTTQNVMHMAELQATPEPDQSTVLQAVAVFRRGTPVQGTVAGVVMGSFVLGMLAWDAKSMHGIEGSKELTAGLMLGLLGLVILVVSPLASIVLPSVLRKPWNTEEGRLRAEAALKFFGSSPWSCGGNGATLSLSQYRQVFLHDLARRADALDQVRQAMSLGPEKDNG